MIFNPHKADFLDGFGYYVARKAQGELFSVD
jgi:hypothetical protein